MACFYDEVGRNGETGRNGGQLPIGETETGETGGNGGKRGTASVARRKSRAGRARHLWVIVLTILIKTLSYRIPTTIPPQSRQQPPEWITRLHTRPCCLPLSCKFLLPIQESVLIRAIRGSYFLPGVLSPKICVNPRNLRMYLFLCSSWLNWFFLTPAPGFVLRISLASCLFKIRGS